MPPNKKMKHLLMTALLALPVAATAAYPDKPIRLVVPYPAGGSTDVLARALSGKVGETLGKPVVVDNRSGASGNIGAAFVANSEPDGYTLFLGTSTALSVNEHLFSKLPYHPQKNFSPIILATMLPSVVVTSNKVHVKTMEELNQWLKLDTTVANYASAGSGTPSHLGGELYKNLTGTKASHIPYKGGAPALTDLIGGQTAYMIAILPEAMPLVKSAQIKALAVTTSKRLAAYPDLPTVAESGVPNYELIGWYGFLAPANTPAPIIEKLNHAFNAALDDPRIREKLTESGYEISGGPPSRLSELMRKESVKWKQVIDKANIKAD